MSESAEALSASLTSRRNVTIEITNLTNTYCLLDPKVFLESGHCHSPSQPTVRPLRTEVCNFGKTAAKMSGAVGVLTYDLYERRNGVTEKLAIMFSVPYDLNVYKNWFSVGIYNKDKETDSKLYNEMYHDKNVNFKREEAKGSGITFQGRMLDIKATMSPMGRAIMKVEVWEKGYNQMAQQNQ